MLYSPLEQFEPIPFFTLFLNEINFSITNITVIFIFIVLVLSYFLNGYFFSLNDNKIINVSHLKVGNVSIDGANYLNYMENLYGKCNTVLHYNKTIFYLSYIVSSATYFKSKDNFQQNVSSKDLANYFYKSYYNLLNSEKADFSNEYTYFKNTNSSLTFIKQNFLSFMYNKVIGLNNIKSNLKLHNVFYNFLSSKNFTKKFIPNFNLFFFENVYNFILNLVKDNIGGPNRQAIKYFPFVFTLFIFVIMCNLIGLIPYSSTITSYLIVTFALAVMVLVGVNIVAARAHGIKYFGHFLPAGCPFSLYFIIIPIEFISYVFRVVSLSVRLFANMMAGHTLLAVLAGFGWTMATSSVVLFLIHPGPVLVVFILVFLETAVALIQAYVFTILTCMYLDEATNMH